MSSRRQVRWTPPRKKLKKCTNSSLTRTDCCNSGGWLMPFLKCIQSIQLELYPRLTFDDVFFFSDVCNSTWLICNFLLQCVLFSWQLQLAKSFGTLISQTFCLAGSSPLALMTKALVIPQHYIVPNFCWVAEVLASCLLSLSKLYVYHVNPSNTLWETVTQLRFRLTRMSSCPHVMDLLLDATGPLQPLHTRVLEAGCEVNPSWKLGCPWCSWVQVVLYGTVPSSWVWL